MYYVYLLKLPNGDYYVGQTENIDLRLKKHLHGAVPSTAKFKSKELVWYCVFGSKEKAIGFEKYLKTASGKAFRNKRLV